MKLKRLFALLFLSSALVVGGLCSTSGDVPNYFNGFQETMVKAAEEGGPEKVDGVLIDHPEQVTSILFTSREDSHLSGTQLVIGCMFNVQVYISERFTNLTNVYVTFVDTVPAFYDHSVDIYMKFYTNSIKNVTFVPTGIKKKAYSRPVHIDADFGGSELTNVLSLTKNWYDDKVTTDLDNFVVNSDYASVTVGPHTRLQRCTLTKYDYLGMHEYSVIDGGHYSLYEPALNAGKVIISPYCMGRSGYFTQSFYNFLQQDKYKNNFLFEGREWVSTGATDYPWMIDIKETPTIDGITVSNPENIRYIHFVTHDKTQVYGSSQLFINIKNSKNIVIGECFKNLESISADTVFYNKSEDVRTDVYINVFVLTKSLTTAYFNYNMCQDDDFYTRLFFNIDLNGNDNMENVVAGDYSGKHNRGFTVLNNFSFSNSNGYLDFGPGASINDVNISNYRELWLEYDCKINSGYYDLNSSAEENLFNSSRCGRGGFYTQAFKDYAYANQPNFVDDGFYWEQTGDERYPWTISGVTMIDGVPIYDKTKIDKVVLTTDGPTRLIWDFNYYTFYVNYSRSINLDFDSSYTNLKTLELSDVFTNYDYGPGKNVYVDVSINTPSLKIVDFYYSSYFGFGFDDYMVYFNIDLNNVPLRKFVCTRRETGMITCVYQMTFNNINKSIMGDAGDLYIHDLDLIFNNCSFLVYNSDAHFHLSFINSNPRINSGYFDYDSSKPFAATNLLLCGYGGLYTESMHTYLINEEPYYVAIGHKWYETGLKDYPWAIVPSERTLSPTPEEIQRDLDDMTTMEGELNRSFAFKIAYSYNYPGEENKFQIQMSFDYEGIMDYYLNVAKSWGKDGFGPSDSLCINFYTSDPDRYISYDLIQDKVFLYSGMGVIVLDMNPQLPDAPLMRGFKVFTLDLGDLLGDDSENKTKEINPTLFFRIVDKPYGFEPVLYEFSSSLHRANTDSSRENAIDYSFAYLLDRYLSMPLYRRNASLLKCKEDLDL